MVVSLKIQIHKSVPYPYCFPTTGFESLGLNSLALFPLDSGEGHVTTSLSGLPNDERNVLSMLYSKIELLAKMTINSVSIDIYYVIVKGLTGSLAWDL